MLMTRKIIFWTIPLLVVGVLVTLYLPHTRPQTNRGTSIEKKGVFGVSIENRNSRNQKQSSGASSTSLKKYVRLQTVDALLEAFGKIAADPEVDEKYPQREWLQMLLTKGIVINNYDDYSGYMAARRSLIALESQPEMWVSDVFGLPPTDDWETFKAAYIDKKIWEYEQFRAAIQADPAVSGGFFTGPGKRTFLSSKPGRVYVKRQGMGAVFFGERLDENQQNALLYEGIHPEGYEIIYIDDNGARLDDAPPPITRKEMFENFTLPPDGWIPPEGWIPPPGVEEALRAKGWTGTFFLKEEPIHPAERNTVNPPKFEEKPAKMLQNGLLESAPLSDEDFARFLDQMSDDELAEFERFLTEESIENVLEPGSPEAQIEMDTLEGFSPERLNRAMDILERYGPVEGHRRLFAEDPALAEQIEKQSLRKGISQKGDRK